MYIGKYRSLGHGIWYGDVSVWHETLPGGLTSTSSCFIFPPEPISHFQLGKKSFVRQMDYGVNYSITTLYSEHSKDWEFLRNFNLDLYEHLLSRQSLGNCFLKLGHGWLISWMADFSHALFIQSVSRK